MSVSCIYCGRDVDPDSAYSFRRIVDGWVHPRRGGGANAVSLLRTSDEWCCSPCMAKLQNGVNPEQLVIG